MPDNTSTCKCESAVRKIVNEIGMIPEDLILQCSICGKRYYTVKDPISLAYCVCGFTASGDDFDTGDLSNVSVNPLSA